MSTLIDPRAIVSSRAELGTGVCIGPYTIIEEGAVIGDGSSVASHALIGRGARIGRNCVIHHGAVVGHTPQDLKYRNEPTTCELGDRNEVREYAVLHRGTADSGRTVIGNDNYFMAFTHVAHDCVIGDHVILSNAAMMAGHCVVEDWVIVGGITPIHQFVHIGCHAMIGGGIRVPKDIPPYVLAGDSPARFLGLNAVGLRRRGFKPEVITAIESAYKLLYRSQLNISRGMARIQEDESLMTFQEVRHILEFIGGSSRGIIGVTRTRG
jgi:UDP-N-acetylglucosamine acyltransferase